MRQRCAWCGAVLLDYDLTMIGVMLEPCVTCIVPARSDPTITVQGDVAPDPDCRMCAGSGQYAPPPSTWPAGRLVTVDHNVSTVLDDGVKLPDDACALLDPAVTA